MTLLFADGFEDGTTPWTLAASMAIGTGRYGNGLVSGAVGSTGQIGCGPAATLIFGFAFKPVGLQTIMSLSSGGAAQGGLQRGSSGEINAFRLNTSTVLGTSATNVLPAAAWSYIELKATLGDTGKMVVRVNGVEVLNLDPVDTRPISQTTYDTLTLGSSAGLATTAYDDVYICDTTGSYNNDFLGDLTVEHLRPASDDTHQWIGSDGNSTDNYALVDEAGTYNGADYVGSATIGHRDLYIPAASSRPTGSAVHGVVVAAIAQKTDAGVRTAKLNVKEGSGGSVRQSAGLGLTTSFAELRAVFERKGDSSQFTIADVNALRMGIEVAT